MTGMEMMLTNMLKAFMPKESAEKIAGWATDGTFDKIGNIPSDLEEIKRDLAKLQFALAKIYAALSVEQQVFAAGNGDGVSGGTVTGLGIAPPTEHGTDGGPGGSVGTSGEPDNGRGVHFTAHNEIGS